MQKIFKRPACVGLSKTSFCCMTQHFFAKKSKGAHAPVFFKALSERQGKTYVKSAVNIANFYQANTHKKTKGFDLPIRTLALRGAQLLKTICLPVDLQSKPKSTCTPKLKNHILEIKARLGYVLFSAACTFFLAYQKAIHLTYIFLLSFDAGDANQSYNKKSFIFTDVSEAFSSTISVCMFFSLFCVLPLFLYHLFCFFSPSWYNFEKKQHRSQIFTAFFCWVCYILFIQIAIIPELCNFLLKFQVKNDCLMITIEPRIIEYISWASSILGVAILLFLLLFIFCFSIKSNTPNSSRNWKKDHKIVFWFSLLVSSILSPPEVWSQLLLACILFTLFETFIWIFFVRFYLRSTCAHRR